ncbi:glycoside hydrolase family 2 protein [Timonella senegalensis]|uniref:glycoside hydrolase family 2 protein n=1 Tax=Timonella senegalensis TaxID=1465825 RepID=UPI0002F6CBB8|nr:sugar-binding domain-containing protein [Timonella senegalensis]
MLSHTLHAGWTLRNTAGEVPAEIAGQVIPAQVPGSVHTDLLAAGLIKDPYVGMEEKALQWLHRTDWAYETTFAAHNPLNGERMDLAFDGLDTVARVVLNGTEVARTYNQHRSYRFDVTELVVEGDNHLLVEFSSALEYAWAQADGLGIRPRAYDHPFNMVRKMACSFGWDWGPDLQTAGIWKPVRFEQWSHVRATATRTLVTVDQDGTGVVEVIMDLEWADANADSSTTQPATLSATVGGAHGIAESTASVTVQGGASTARVTVRVPDAPLWWPVGYGEHPLFSLTAELTSSRETRATYERRIGFRTVTVNTTPDEHGTGFTLNVNGVDVFVKGANWIPDDHLLTRITRDQLQRRADQALDANMNMLRVWGGGIYETDDFYDVCDERGIMVWQDFLLACASYPEESPFYEEFEAEARDNVARLSSHASLVIWNGGNENLWGFLDWGWQRDLEGQTWGFNLYTELFPRIVAELDPTRPYSDGSPYSPGFTAELAEGTASVHPNDQRHGTRHEWEVWNRQDYLTHLDYTPRFCSEFGHQGPPTWSTLIRSVSPEGRHKDAAEFLLHQKAGDGNLKLDKGLAPHLPTVEDFTEWTWVTQLNQAHSVSFGIEHFRSCWPHTAGSIMWQINDCWPVTSWAAIDGDEREKPLFFALRHAHAPRLLTVKPRSEVVGGGKGAVQAALGAEFGEDLAHGRAPLGRPVVFAHNDTDEPWAGTLRFERQSLVGETLAFHEEPAETKPRAVASWEIPAALLEAGDPRAEVLVVTLGEQQAFHYFVELKDLALDPAALTWEVTSAGQQGGEFVTSVVLAASSLAVDTAILADRLHPDAKVSDQLITIRAGETATVRITAPIDADEIAAALESPETAHFVIKSVNSIRG